MTNPDADPTLREVAQGAAQASDAAAELLSSLGALGRSVWAAHVAGSSVGSIGRSLRRGRAHARERRALSLIRPSVRLAEHAAEVIAAAASSGLTDVQVFGSCVRGEDTCSSDVDLIVTISERTSLLDLSRYALDVEDLLGLDVGRADVVTGDSLRPDSDGSARIAAEAQPLAAWAAGWPRLDSIKGWFAACAAAATEEELVEASECGLHPRGEPATQLRIRPAGRPAGATLVDPGELARVSEVLDRYAAARPMGVITTQRLRAR